MGAPVVVGYDASEPAGAALVWAAREARARGATLCVVYVRDADDLEVAARPHGVDLGGRGDAGAWPVVEEAAALARDAAPGLRTETAVEYAPPAAALVGLSRDAAALVLGATRHGSLYEALRGTVLLQVTAHARCPVIVVPADGARPGLAPEAPVVVGYDGSGPAGLALDAGAQAAWWLGRPLRVVVVWRPGAVEWMAPRGSSGHAAEGVAEVQDAAGGVAEVQDAIAAHDVTEAAAGVLLERALARVEAALRDIGARPGSVEVAGAVRAGHVVRVLHREAEAAERLVLGTRGRGGFASLLLGSAAHTLVRVAPCPVQLVREPG